MTESMLCRFVKDFFFCPMFFSLFALLVIASQTIECAPGKNGKRGKKTGKNRSGAVVATVTTTPANPSPPGIVETLDAPAVAQLSEQNGYETLTGFNCYNCGRDELRAEPKFLTCGRCKTTNYCSKKCQKDNWPDHSVLSRLIP
jgi:hypothetical protein